MIQLATPATPSVTLIPLHMIVSDPQIRMRNGFDPESIGQLAASIKRLGLLQPIMVREHTAHGASTYTVLAGHRRLEAMRALDFPEAPALVADSDDEQAFERQLAENIQREQRTLADTAGAVRMLHHIHGKPDTIGKIVGKSKSWVSKHLALTSSTFPPLVRSLLDDGVTDDLELLQAIVQVKRLDESTRVYVNLINDVRAGNAGRAEARKVLQKLKAPPINTEPDPHAGDDEDGTDSDTIAGRIEVAFSLTPEQHELFESLGGAAWIRRQLKVAAK